MSQFQSEEIFMLGCYCDVSAGQGGSKNGGVFRPVKNSDMPNGPRQIVIERLSSIGVLAAK